MPVKIYTEFQRGVCLRFCTFFSFLHEHLLFFVMHRLFLVVLGVLGYRMICIISLVHQQH